MLTDRPRSNYLPNGRSTRPFFGLQSIALAVAAIAVVCLADRAPAADAAVNDEFFEKQIRPVLAETCLNCHGPKKQEAGLRLDTKAGIEKGSDGGPVIDRKQPDASLLLEVLSYEHDIKMPPKQKLDDGALAAIRTWVQGGAPWPTDHAANTGGRNGTGAADHWAFQPLKQVAPPMPKNPAWAKTPIDLFILDQLEKKNLFPSAPADKRTLIRRATYDLTGLPPTFDEVEAFVHDSSPDAYARLVDRLLDSPAYGERWGRHWLDVARYADTKGYVFTAERRYPFSYTYRDYVIAAMNEDKPYDDFVKEQLAADSLDLGDENAPLAALGFLTVGRRFLNNQQDIIDDRIDVVTRGFMGVTITCCRCHDHKFDPFTQEDYYGLYGVFSSSVEPEDLPVLGGPQMVALAKDFADQLKKLEAQMNEFLEKRRQEIQADVRARVDGYLVDAYNAQVAGRGRRGNQADVGDRNPRVGRWLAGTLDRYLDEAAQRHDPIVAPWIIYRNAGSREFAGKFADLLKQIEQLPADKPINPLVLAALKKEPPKTLKEVVERYGALFAEAGRRNPAPADSGSDPDAAAWKRLREFVQAPGGPFALPIGDVERVLDRKFRDELTGLKKKVENLKVTHPASPPRAMVMRDAPEPRDVNVMLRGNPGRPGKIAPRRMPVTLAPNSSPFTKGSGRSELAEQIASHPLTLRVIVNRLWMDHFGVGLVTTASDFGLRSDPPSHPELLEYLSIRLQAGGQSLKDMHRLIMLSSVYQQRSDIRPDGVAADPENRLLWKFPRRRLDFEATRDSMLAAGGAIDRQMGGRGVSITQTPLTRRRTVYGFIDRQNLDAIYRTFDFPNPDASSPRRHETTVPQQALFLMNSPFVVEQAQRVANELQATANAPVQERIAGLYRQVLGRSPDADELALAERSIRVWETEKDQKLNPWQRLAQVLLLTNEFSYVD